MAWQQRDFDVGPATRADEADLRRLVGSTPMPGALAIRFEREPDYFLGCDIMGRTWEVLIARHRASGALAGMMCRTEDDLFVDGRPARVGGISQVRIAPQFRGLHLLEMGWPAFRSRGIPYLGVIARDNPRAVKALVGRAPGAPALERVGGITTLGFPVRRRAAHRALRTPWPSARRGAPLQVTADRVHVDELVAFLNAEGRRRQFAPVRTRVDFTAGRRLRGLDMSSVFVVRRAGRLVGTLALWDQRAYKQDIVDSYGRSLARLRPVLDLALRASGAAPLPEPGGEIVGAFAALNLVVDDDARVFAVLLDAVLAAARRRGLQWVTLGMSDDDPLLAVARRRLHVTYRSDLYCASWDGAVPAGTDRRPYIEAATF